MQRNDPQHDLPFKECTGREELPWTMPISRDEAIVELDLQRVKDERFGDVVVSVGYCFEKTISLETEAVQKFASFFDDRNPIHHDVAFAEATRYGAIIASGPHTLALFTAMVATHFSSFTPMVGLEFAYKFLRAVKAEDRLTMSWEVTSLVRKNSLRGVLAHLKGAAINQDGDMALSGTGTVLLTRSL